MAAGLYQYPLHLWLMAAGLYQYPAHLWLTAAGLYQDPAHLWLMAAGLYQYPPHLRPTAVHDSPSQESRKLWHRVAFGGRHDKLATIACRGKMLCIFPRTRASIWLR